MRGDYTCTVRSTLLIKRQEPLKKYWTNISCFGGKVWIWIGCSAMLSERLGTGKMGIVATEDILIFYRGEYKVSVKGCPFLAQNLFTQIGNYFL